MRILTTDEYNEIVREEFKIMIGGIVIETIVPPDRVWINCEEPNSTSQCAIYVANSAKARSVSNGDSVWWQGNRAFWTPKTNTGETVGRSDIVLDRIGCSGVSRPV